MKHIEVVAAIIVHDGKILAMQRGYGNYAGSWEFPGGKIEPGETPEAALVREIHEELDATIEVGPLLITVDYDYPEFAMTMHCYVCKLESEMKLLEHSDARWLGADELDSVGWLAADEEVIEAIKKTKTI
ncbi:MAG: (deoxy)nucleoside triphosphate pyrophosphohydrolase [Coriobacteriales bacterium]